MKRWLKSWQPRVTVGVMQLNLSLNPASRWTRPFPSPGPRYVNQHQSSDTGVG